MRKTLTIGQAAAQLGVEVDTLRRLERDGAIRAERTQGGHRRFNAVEIARFARSRSGRRVNHAASTPPSRRRATRTVEHPITRAAQPVRIGDAPTRSPPPEEEPVFIKFENNPDALPVTPPVRVQALAPDRLESLKSYGLTSIPFDVPAGWRAKVIADLERFVSATQFPKHVSNTEAHNIVAARVEDVLSPFREQQARESARKQAEEQARWRVVALSSHGSTYAIRETAEWDWSAQSEARREVADELASKINADWSERDVEKLVDEVLSDWEEEDDEDDDDEDKDQDDEYEGDDEAADWYEEE